MARWEEPHHPGPWVRSNRHANPLSPTLQHNLVRKWDTIRRTELLPARPRPAGIGLLKPVRRAPARGPPAEPLRVRPICNPRCSADGALDGPEAARPSARSARRGSSAGPTGRGPARRRAGSSAPRARPAPRSVGGASRRSDIACSWSWSASGEPKRRERSSADASAPSPAPGHALAKRGDRLALRHAALDLRRRDRQLRASGPVGAPRRSRPARSRGCARRRFRPRAGRGRPGSAATSRARRRRAARSSSASGATNPGRGQRERDDDRQPAGHRRRRRAPRAAPRPPRPPTLPASTARDRDPLGQPGALQALRDAEATARRRRASAARPPLSGRPRALAKPTELLPPAPRQLPEGGRAQQHRERDQGGDRRRAGAHAVARSATGAGSRRSRASWKRGGDAPAARPTAGWRAARPTNPGSISSANSGGAGRHRDHQQPGEARLRGGRAGVGGDPVALGRGRPRTVAAARRGRRRRAAGRGARRRTSRPGPSAGAPEAPPSASAVDAPSSRSARSRASSAAGGPRSRPRRGERPAHRAAAGERVGDRGRDLRQPALDRPPVARPAAATAQAAAPGPASAESGAGAGPDHEQPARRAAPPVPSAASRRRSSSVGA